MKIIGFTGPKGSGKDSAYEILKDQGIVEGKLSFANPLKKLCSEIFKMDLIMFNDPVLKEKALKEPLTLTAKHLRQIQMLMVDIVNPYDFEYNPNKATVSGLDGRVLNTPREILQVVGTDYIRNRVHVLWHCVAFLQKSQLPKNFKNDALYSVTDVRFLNEYKYLLDKLSNDFVCYYVERPSAESNLAEAKHQSELEVLEVKKLLGGNIIVNDGSLEDLKAKLSNLKFINEGVKDVSRKRFKGK